MKDKSNLTMLKKIDDFSNKFDLVIKLLGIIAAEKDFASMTQEHQIVSLYKRGFRNKEISNIFGIKPQQVNNAVLKAKKKKAK